MIMVTASVGSEGRTPSAWRKFLHAVMERNPAMPSTKLSSTFSAIGTIFRPRYG
jgi:hypothetical protein